MPYPKQIEIEVPLLEALAELGGEAKPRDVYPLVTKRFPQITNVEVTKRSQDGGLDGHDAFRQCAISIRSAFQAKRWTDNTVGRPEIDKFRGAIQGDFDHGVFLTTSRFSREAKLASYKKGAITVLLLDGPAVTDLLVERGIGVRKIPIHLYDIDDEFFDFEEE